MNLFNLILLALVSGIDGESVSNSMSGRHFRVIWTQWNGNPKGLSGPIKGGVIMEYLAARFNFTFSYVRVTENWLEPKNKTRGLFNYLWDEEADVLISTLVPSSQRMQLVDLTSYVTVENFKLLIPVQEDVTNNASAIIKPFQWQVWLLLLVFIILTTLTFKNIQSLLLRRNQSTSSSTNPYFYVFGNLMSQGVAHTANRLAIRLVAGTWSLAAFVIVQAYMSTLITFILAPTYSPLVTSFHDLADKTDVTLLIKTGGTIENMFKNTNDSEFLKKLALRTRPEPEYHCTLVSECIGRIKPGEKYVFADGAPYQMDAIKERFEKTGKCDMQLLQDHFWTVPIVIGLKLNSPFTSTISKGLNELQENGLFNYWDLWFRPMPAKCLPNIRGTINNKPIADGELRRLSLKNLTGAFVVLGVGIGISFIVFLIELALSIHRRS